jgi:hypothetical protein
MSRDASCAALAAALEGDVEGAGDLLRSKANVEGLVGLLPEVLM